MATTHQTFLDKLQGKKKLQRPPEERWPGVRYAMIPAVTIIVGRKGMGNSCMIVDALMHCGTQNYWNGFMIELLFSRVLLEPNIKICGRN